MPESQPNSPVADQKTESTMTVAEAAKLVKRTVFEPVEGRDGKPRQVEKKVAVAASEVLAFKDYGSHVVVVTKDGQKFSSANE